MPKPQDMPRIDISPEQWVIVRDILHRRVPHDTVWAFGSRAVWKAKPYSDLDIAIISLQALDWSVSASLAEDFAESDLPFKVDVVDWASTSAAFRKIIVQDKVVLQSGGSV
jgi:type I restriction enzyme, S subunit